MRLRTFLLATFMVVVPLLAMFSHHIPPEWNEAMRERIFSPAASMLADLFETTSPADAEPAASPPPAAAVARAESEPSGTEPPREPAPAPTPAADPAVPPPERAASPAAVVVMPTVTVPGPNEIPPSEPLVDQGLAVPGSISDAMTAKAAPPQTTLTAAEAPEPATLPQAGELGATAAETIAAIKQLGGTAIECLPSEGKRRYRCSCRVAADPSGQLQRVFHASGHDPESALSAMARDVEAWKARIASRPSVPPAGEARPSRF